VFIAVGAILPRLTLRRTSRSGSSRPPRTAGRRRSGCCCSCSSASRPLLVGGAFLDYGAIEVAGLAEPRIRYLGILVVEVAVGARGVRRDAADLRRADRRGAPMIELFLDRYVYWLVLVLLAIGLYGVLAKTNLVKKVIGLTIFSTAIYLFFIEGSLQEGHRTGDRRASAPIRRCTSTRSPTC
jgi:hypothetical protein